MLSHFSIQSPKFAAPTKKKPLLIIHRKLNSSAFFQSSIALFDRSEDHLISKVKLMLQQLQVYHFALELSLSLQHVLNYLQSFGDSVMRSPKVSCSSTSDSSSSLPSRVSRICADALDDAQTLMTNVNN
jgi:hypothetical protein